MRVISANPAGRLAWCVSLTGIFFVLSGVAVGENATYRYLDKDGTIHFTDDAGSIPETYRDRVTVVGPAPAPGPQRPTVERSSAPPQASWSDRWAGWGMMSLPMPSRFQWGIGLAGLVLTLGALWLLRATGNPLVKLALKVVVFAVAAGVVAVFYLSDLNERISIATQDDPRPTTNGAALLDDGRDFLGGTADTLSRTFDATIGEAQRVLGTANHTNQQSEQMIRTLDE